MTTKLRNSAIAPHSTATSDAAWDGPANEKRLKLDQPESYYRKAYAWQDSDGDATKKSSYKFIHHEVASDGDIKAANIEACRSGIAVLNGSRGGTTIPAGDKKGVYDHLAKHLRDAGVEPPEYKGDSARSGFRAETNPEGTLELAVYQEIGADWFGNGLTAASIKEAIDQAAPHSNIRVRINSPGGDAFEGMAIHNLLRAQKKPIEVCIDGIAASSASIVAMAGDTITMGHNAMMMIHNAWSLCVGEAADMRKMADTLDKVSASIAQTYVDRTGKSMDEVTALMDAETWMSAEECVDEGFATQIAELPGEQKALAQACRFKALAKMRRVPDKLKASDDPEPQPAPDPQDPDPAGDPDPAPDSPTCDCPCDSCQAGDCLNCTHDSCACENCQDCPMKPDSGDGYDNSNLSLYKSKLSLLRRRSAA